MFECRRIDQVDGKRGVVATGVAWSEVNPWVEGLSGLRDVLIAVVGIVVMTGGIFAAIAQGPAWLILAAGGIGLIIYAHVSQPFEFGRRPRALIFHRDGRVEAPQGFPFFERTREMSRPHGEIASIEARQIVTGEAAKLTAYRYGVVVYLRSGGVIYVARRLDEFEAHKVAVQLSLALGDIRHELGNNSGRQRQAAPSRAAAREETVIG